MIHLNYDEHLTNVTKELYYDEDFSDIFFITEKKTFHGHFSLIFQQIPSLANLVCEGCIASHEKIVIFLPEIGPDVVATALLEFYLKGDVAKLKSVLGVEDVDDQNANIEISEDTEKLMSETDTNLCSKIDTEKCHNLSVNEIFNVSDVNSYTTTQVPFENTRKVKSGKNIMESDKSNIHKKDGLNELHDPLFSSTNIQAKQIKPIVEDSRREMLIMCDLCEKDYETVYGLDTHRRKVHGVGKEEGRKKHKCSYCGKYFTYIDQHIKTTHKEASGISVCDVCRKTINSNLKKHRGECIFCPYCAYKNLKKNRLLEHIETKHKNRKLTIQTQPIDLTSKIGL